MQICIRHPCQHHRTLFMSLFTSHLDIIISWQTAQVLDIRPHKLPLSYCLTGVLHHKGSNRPSPSGHVLQHVRSPVVQSNGILWNKHKAYPSMALSAQPKDRLGQKRPTWPISDEDRTTPCQASSFLVTCLFCIQPRHRILNTSIDQPHGPLWNKLPSLYKDNLR